MVKRLAPICFILLFAAAATAQVGVSSRTHDAPESSAASDEVFRQLLYLPAPMPGASESKEEEPSEKTRPPEFFDETKPPPDDAPTDDLLDYWERWSSSTRHRAGPPTDAVRRRLLAACEAGPERLPRLISLLPDAPETAERVKKLYDAAQGSEKLDDAWRMRVREWLEFNSVYFVSELLGDARKAHDKSGYVDGEAGLRALAKVEWDSAEPLLRSLSSGGQPRTAALALALLHRHALEAKDSGGEELFRARLQAIASDRNAPGHARDTTVEELSLTEWPGRDEWYLSLFADETLRQPVDGNFGFSPLKTLFERDPDKWIPLAAKMVESRDDAVRRNAASCLVKYAVDHPRRDAILPVLRWLTDPDWLDISGSEYARLIGALDKLEMPESVPALIWVVEHDGGADASYAARTLAHYRDPRAVPAMKKALAEEGYEEHRHNILQGLIASGGLSEEEQVAGLEAYAVRLNADGGRAELMRYRSHGDEPLPLPVSVGNYLAKQKDAPDSLVRAVLARAEVLRKSDPARARALLGVAEDWQAKQVESDMLRRVGAGSADAETIANALGRRAKLRESLTPALHILAGGGGSPQGFAAVMLGDEALARSILDSKDARAQVALLACARTTQTTLPVAQVGVLLRGKDELLALAAERYLLAEDSREARALLWARHPGEAFVTGWRDDRTPVGGGNFSAMGRAEEKLRAELFGKEDAPLELFALLDNDERPTRVIRVYERGAVFTRYEDASRYRVRAVTLEELGGFRNFVATNNLLDLGPQISPCHYDCYASEFLSVTRESGRRVFSQQGFAAWLGVLLAFDRLGLEGSKLHYLLEDEIKGLEILVADETLSVSEVWQKGDDLRVLVESAETPEDEARRSRADDDDGDDVDDDDGVDDEARAAAARAKHRMEWLESKRARTSWRAFAAGKLGANAAQPEGYSASFETAAEIDYSEFPYHFNERPARASASGFYVLAGNAGGLWKQSRGGKAVRLSGEGSYANPLVTPDGAWAVAAKTDSDWARPNGVVRFDLRNNREYTVSLPPASQFEPVAYVAAHGKVLLRRARDDGDTKDSSGPAAPEFYLLDAATGRTQAISGLFEPLLQEATRPLQPTGRPDEVWAAIPDRSKNETRVGRYSLRDFSFHALLTVPHLTFDSFRMWVDEAGAKLLVVYKGQLLRMPLQPTQPTASVESLLKQRPRL
jgi:hypothetical protein